MVPACQAIDAQLGNGGSSFAPEECLDLWINENPSDEQREEALAAVRQGLEDMYAGRTRSAREAIAELRRKHKKHQCAGARPVAARSERFRDFSPFSTKLEMTGHTNPRRQQGFGEPYVYAKAAEPSLAPRVNIRDDWRPI